MVRKQGNLNEKEFIPIDSEVWCHGDRLQPHDAYSLNRGISARVYWHDESITA
jgi:hypothetical protein